MRDVSLLRVSKLCHGRLLTLISAKDWWDHDRQGRMSGKKQGDPDVGCLNSY